MNLTKEKLKKNGKQAAKTVAGLLAAASLALGGIVDAPEELFSGAPAAQVVRCDTGADDCLTTAATSASDHKERLRDKLRRLFLAAVYCARDCTSAVLGSRQSADRAISCSSPRSAWCHRSYSAFC
ncbi:MAG: hypothetical protein R2881_06170 [Eubacteriales bacterium]